MAESAEPAEPAEPVESVKPTEPEEAVGPVDPEDAHARWLRLLDQIWTDQEILNTQTFSRARQAYYVKKIKQPTVGIKTVISTIVAKDSEITRLVEDVPADAWSGADYRIFIKFYQNTTPLSLIHKGILCISVPLHTLNFGIITHVSTRHAKFRLLSFDELRKETGNIIFANQLAPPVNQFLAHDALNIWLLLPVGTFFGATGLSGMPGEIFMEVVSRRP